MTKAEQIRNLYDGKRSTQEIAKIVGCRQEYVRVVALQRVPGGHDANAEYQRKWRQIAREHGCREAARKAYRAAYHRERNSGGSPAQCRSVGGGAYANALRKTALAKFCNQ